MNLYKDVRLLYENLYKQCTQNKNYVYKSVDRDRKLILKFIVWIIKKYGKDKITNDLLIQYFEFQFSYYRGVITPSGKNSIMMNWIVGPMAIKRWEERNIKENHVVRWRVQRDNIKLSISDEVKKKKVNKALLFRYLKQINPIEEQEKLRYLNKRIGYIHCRDFTTLYNPNSEICNKKCAYKEQCIKRLKKNFPKLYKLRMGDE